MAANKLIEEHKNGAEIHHGAICREKTMKLLDEFSIPKGLFSIDKIDEFGFNRATGFMWLKIDKKKEHKFKSLGQTAAYSTEITAFLEKGHMSKLSGVKAKELLVSVTICDVLVGVPSPDMMKCTTPIGLSRIYPIAAFQLEDEGNSSK